LHNVCIIKSGCCGGLKNIAGCDGLGGGVRMQKVYLRLCVLFGPYQSSSFDVFVFSPYPAAFLQLLLMALPLSQPKLQSFALGQFAGTIWHIPRGCVLSPLWYVAERNSQTSQTHNAKVSKQLCLNLSTDRPRKWRWR
jgi:hypothetical protein